MRDRLRLRPQVECLESMALLSGASMAFAAMSAAATSPVAVHEITLSGMVTGNYHAKEIPDAGKTYTFFGHGKVHPLNHVVMSGNVQLPGLIVSPVATTTPPVVEAHGQVFLSDGRGSLTLTLSAPSHDNATTLPPDFHYTITDASGQFKGDTGSGYLTIDVTPASAAAASLAGEHGTFKLMFLLVPPPTTTSGT